MGLWQAGRHQVLQLRPQPWKHKPTALECPLLSTQAVQLCHSYGIVHRDVKLEASPGKHRIAIHWRMWVPGAGKQRAPPLAKALRLRRTLTALQNFLLSDDSDHAALKLCDLGLSAWIRPGEVLQERAGSAMYIVSERAKLDACKSCAPSCKITWLPRHLSTPPVLSLLCWQAPEVMQRNCEPAEPAAAGAPLPAARCLLCKQCAALPFDIHTSWQPLSGPPPFWPLPP